MTDEEKTSKALSAYGTICKFFESHDLKFEKDDSELKVVSSFTGDDLPMRLVFITDINRQSIRLLSYMPFDMSKDKLLEGALASCIASYGLAWGGFSIDTDGTIVFKLTASYIDSDISEDLVLKMILFSNGIIDKYNDKFLAINSGLLSIDDFLKAEKSS